MTGRWHRGIPACCLLAAVFLPVVQSLVSHEAKQALPLTGRKSAPRAVSHASSHLKGTPTATFLASGALSRKPEQPHRLRGGQAWLLAGSTSFASGFVGVAMAVMALAASVLGQDEGHGHSDGHAHPAHSHDHSHSHSHGHSHGHTSPVPGLQYFPALQAFMVANPALCAVAASFIVSCSSLFVLPFMAFLKPSHPDDALEIDVNSSMLLKVLISFAVGGLLGDVFLHMLPHAIAKTFNLSNNLFDQAMGFGLPVLVGMLLFYVTEKGVSALTGASHSHGHGHGHGHVHAAHEHVVACETGGPHVVKCGASGSGSGEEECVAGRRTLYHEICHRCEALLKRATGLAKPAAYLNILADLLHNFSDGLALGVAFGKGVGLPTTLAVFFHEVPHNIADFAILIQNGLSHGAALRVQFASAVGAVLGTLAGLRLQDMRGMEGLIAGGFIYIATVDIVPLMLTDTKFSTIIFETLAMAAGVAMNVLLLHIEATVPGACAH